VSESLKIGEIRTAVRSLVEGLESHILNFYEDLDMPIRELYEVIDAIAHGELEDIQEKMDGINITFTVINGELRFFSKGPTWATIQKGGLNKDTINVKHQHNQGVRDAFLLAYGAISEIVLFEPAVSERLFKNGQVVVEASVMTPSAPNTIVYEEPHIRFIQAVALAPGAEVDRQAYVKFISFANVVSSALAKKIDFGSVPLLKLKMSLDSSDEITDLKLQIDDLLSSVGLSKNSTMGDYATHVVAEKLTQMGFPEKLRKQAAVRIVTGEKSRLPKADVLAKGGPLAWKTLQELEDARSDLISETIIPMERIIQRIGVYAFKNLDFALASNTHESGEQLRSFVRDVRKAFEAGHIIADPVQLSRIRVSLARIGDKEDLFEKAVEGIVFRWKGKTRKLTGMFTPINKLRGFFNYGTSPAKIADPELREAIRCIVRGSSGR